MGDKTRGGRSGGGVSPVVLPSSLFDLSLTPFGGRGGGGGSWLRSRAVGGETARVLGGDPTRAVGGDVALPREGGDIGRPGGGTVGIGGGTKGGDEERVRVTKEKRNEKLCIDIIQIITSIVVIYSYIFSLIY